MALKSYTLDVDIGELELYKIIEHDKFAKPHKEENSERVQLDTFDVVKKNLPHMFTAVSNSDDFLFGQYIAHLVKQDYKTMPLSIKSFHGGMSADDILKGIFEGLHKSTKWNFYGADRRHLDKYSRYVGKSPNLLDINAARVTCNQAEQIAAKTAGGDFDFCIMDIVPRDTIHVLVMSLFSRIVKRGKLTVIRLPDQPEAAADIIAFLTLTHSVQVFKSPFGRVKYYLLLRSVKKYPEAFVLNFLTQNLIKKQRAFIARGITDELPYNLQALINYSDRKFTQDAALRWYTKNIMN